MGGLGSGEWRTGKVTTEASYQLDIRFMRKQGWLIPGQVGSLSWNVKGNPAGSIGYTVYDDCLKLNYSCTFSGQNEYTLIKQSIFFDVTKPHYGGERKWFLCPQCDERKAVLYLHEYRFICRKCADLSYQCQHEQPLDRNYRQARKIRHKLVTDVWKGTHLEFNPDNLSHKPLFKPKFMHQTTWNRLRLKQARKIGLAMEQLACKIGLNLD